MLTKARRKRLQHSEQLAKSLQKIRALIQTGADLNREDENGDTLLSVAAYDGHVELVQFLLQTRRHQMYPQYRFDQISLTL